MSTKTTGWVLIQKSLSDQTSLEKNINLFLNRTLNCYKLFKNFYHGEGGGSITMVTDVTERLSLKGHAESLSSDHTGSEQKNPGKSLQGFRLSVDFLF